MPAMNLIQKCLAVPNNDDDTAVVKENKAKNMLKEARRQNGQYQNSFRELLEKLMERYTNKT